MSLDFSNMYKHSLNISTFYSFITKNNTQQSWKNVQNHKIYF